MARETCAFIHDFKVVVFPRRKAISETEKLFKDKSENIEFKSDILENPTLKVSSLIIDYAEREKVDLIVVGNRGRHGFKRLLLGSVASDIVTYSHCPVLVVK